MGSAGSEHCLSPLTERGVVVLDEAVAILLHSNSLRRLENEDQEGTRYDYKISQGPFQFALYFLVFFLTDCRSPDVYRLSRGAAIAKSPQLHHPEPLGSDSDPLNLKKPSP
ncbi:hypothetical protein BHM03_00007058 [Ensete ventricosum]|uniref:Uncharacterized protein n=1 Tax=Ensete ventricosum TaxID=4639 RepID=A0A427A925_ENSVE|nr:hypothetical protein B296_00026459 [Ensete ventricosum]RZR71747.1 hypothetical protein BHM03_00007058 [Ensete ventricosum]